MLLMRCEEDWDWEDHEYTARRHTGSQPSRAERSTSAPRSLEQARDSVDRTPGLASTCIFRYIWVFCRHIL